MTAHLKDHTHGAKTSTVSRRRFPSTSTGVASAMVSTKAIADILADVPAREPGCLLWGKSERSSHVQISRIPESGLGIKLVDPADAINSKAPLDRFVGTITLLDLHYERSHGGNLDLDPAKHRLLIQGMTEESLVLSMDDIRLMPSISWICFLECSGNGWENWKKEDETLTVPNTHGLISTLEWTGVSLSHIIEPVGVDLKSTWMLAGGSDAAGLARSILLTDEIIAEAILAFGQNGESLRSAHGYPLRLLIPGMEGNLRIKWLRRLKFSDLPFMTRWETARYTQLLANGKAMQF